MSRIENWRFCWRVAVDRPFYGGGFKFFSRDVFARYYPEFLSRFNQTWDTHNIYFAILTAHGFPAFFVWSGMIFFCFLSCWQLQRLASDNPEMRPVWVYSNMIMVSLVAFLVNGSFVNMEYFDLPFHWVAVVVSMRAICEGISESSAHQVEVQRTVLAS
jgi:O-antigen ligase